MALRPGDPMLSGRRLGVPGADRVSLVPLAALLVLSAGISFALYWKVVSVDAGWLGSNDSTLYLTLIQERPFPLNLLSITYFAFIPGQLFIYYVMHTLAGTWWTPWGVMAVICHAFLAASVAMVIYHFSRSFTAAIVVLVPLVTAWSLSSGVLTNFTHACLALMMGLMVLAPILVDRYVRKPSWPWAGMLYAVSLFTVLVAVSGAPVWLSMLLFGVGLRAVYATSGSWRERLLRIDRQDLGLLGIVAAAVVTYGALYIGPLASIGWRFPTAMDNCPDPTVVPVVDRLLFVASFGYVGATATGGVTTLPLFIGAWRYAAFAMTVILIGGSLWVAFSRPAVPAEYRVAALAIGGLLVMALVVSAMVVMGRPCVSFWHMRYNAFPTVYTLAAVGIVIGLALQALPRNRSVLVAGVLLAGSLFVTYGNVQVVTGSSWMVDRAPGMVKALGLTPAR